LYYIIQFFTILDIVDNFNKTNVLPDHSVKPMINCYSGHKFCSETQYSAANRLPEFLIQCQVLKTLDVHCHSDGCNAAGGRSAGCRTSWVCL